MVPSTKIYCQEKTSSLAEKSDSTEKPATFLDFGSLNNVFSSCRECNFLFPAIFFLLQKIKKTKKSRKRFDRTTNTV